MAGIGIGLSPVLGGGTGRGQTIVIFGDSITAQNSNQAGQYDPVSGSEPINYYYDGSGYFSWANAALGHRFTLLRNAGVGGNTTAQMLARIDSDVLAYGPAFCVVEGGVNDVTNAVSAATTQANLQSIYEALEAAGIRVVACTITPSTSADTAGEQTALTSTNDWIRTYAASNPSIVLCDWYSAMADAPNTPKSGLTKDGTHPTPDGAATMGAVLATALDAVSVPEDRLITSSSQTNLLTNGLMTGGTTLATGWSQNWNSTVGTYTGSKVARSDGKPGEWQQIVLTSAGTLQFYQQNQNLGTDWNVGDRVQAEVEFETNSDFSGVSQFRLSIDFFGTTGNASDLFHRGSDAAASHSIASGVLRTPIAVVPASTTRLQFFVRFFGTGGTIRVSRARMWKLPS